MPSKPTWCGSLADVEARLNALPDPWIDRQTLENILGVGRRRAQQILAPCAARQLGTTIVADRQAVLAHLRRLAGDEAAHYETRRRQRLAEKLAQIHRDKIQRPEVLVEAPAAVVRQQFEGLPEGILIAPGEITIRFATSTQALERLLALAMAIGNNPSRFEELVQPHSNLR